MTANTDPPLPRPPQDSDRLQRLREEAVRRVEEEERAGPMRPAAPGSGEPGPPIVIYGGPPAPVYGGPPPGKRGLSRRGVLGAIIVLLGALVGWLLGRRRPQPVLPPATVYGGPAPPGEN